MSDWSAELPDTIGPYRVLDCLGEGGMGVVYRCEQTSPLRREIAVKVVRGGMNSREVVRRFEAERQALALMDHPNIAKVFEAGSTQDGRPYFAMQLARGVPITEYADLHRLSIGERVELFMAVCGAVQHAHQKGVIHRDLKPSNVIVTIHDGAPVPIVIDFGIAKSIHGSLVDRTQVTRIGESLGTLEYMSPEQAESGGLDVDTLTDVYSLGALLYELLVGVLPFEPHELQGLKALATLRHKDPPAPSQRLVAMREGAADVARLRRTDPERLARELRGDLDWIVLTAMAKDRTRRYETANALKLDLERLARSEPVRARPPSRLYQARKFAERHRGIVLAGALATVAVVGGAVLATVGMVRARAAEGRAVAEAAVAEEVTDFLAGLFEAANPDATRGGGRETPVGELLDRGAERIGQDLVGSESTRRRLLRVMGASYFSLGAYDEAIRLHREALEVAESSGAPDEEAALILAGLGDAHTWAGEYEPADTVLRRAIELAEAAGDVLVEARARAILGEGLLRRGREEEAQSMLVRATELARPIDSGAARRQLSVSLTNLSILHHSRGDFETAEPLSQEALQIALVERPGCACLGPLLQNLAALQQELGRLDSAAVLYERARPIIEEGYGELHIATAGLYLNMGELEMKRGELLVAEAHLTRALALAEGSIDTEHPLTAMVLQDLVDVWEGSGRLSDAELALSRAIVIQEALFGPSSSQVVELQRRRVDLLRRLGRVDEARTLETRIEAADRS